jgi:hypothetical protein
MAKTYVLAMWCPVYRRCDSHFGLWYGTWEPGVPPEIERQQKLGKHVVLRADAAFAKPKIYEALEERGVKYAIRIPSNDSLERDIAELLTGPVGHPSLQASGLAQELPGSGGQFEDGAPRRGQGGVPF